MKNTLLALAVTFASLTGFAQTGKISLAKAAELAAHRVDRLVALSKIDASFLKKLETIESKTVENAAPVVYRSVVSQTAPAAGSAMQLEILSDVDGKPLSFKILPGGAAGPDQQWSDKDAGSLIENGMHFVLENNAKPEIAPYNNSFASLKLIKGTVGGQAVAALVVKSSTQPQKLMVYLKLDGTFVSSEVLP